MKNNLKIALIIFGIIFLIIAITITVIVLNKSKNTTSQSQTAPPKISELTCETDQTTCKDNYKNTSFKNNCETLKGIYYEDKDSNNVPCGYCKKCKNVRIQEYILTYPEKDFKDYLVTARINT